MNAHRAGKALKLAIFSGIVLGLAVAGCSTYQAPAGVETITIEKRVQVPAPEITREEPPAITAGCAIGEDPAGPCWSPEEAKADPEGWNAALLSDLGAWVNGWFRLDGKIDASNSTRPTEEPEPDPE